MVKKILFFNILFIVLTTSLLFPIQADAWWLGGQVYSDEGTTLLPDGKTVRLKLNGGGEYTSVTSGGWYGWANIVPYNAGDTLTVFIDGDAGAKGTIVTIAKDDHILDLDIYQDHIIARSDQSGVELTIADMATYDNDDDPDIKFTAETGITDSLEVDDDNVFYIWPETTVSHNALIGAAELDDITIKGTYEINATWSFVIVSGSWDNSGTYINDTPNGVSLVGFDSDSGGQESIKSGGFSFMQTVGFDDGGADTTWVLEDTLEVRGDLYIGSGTLDVNEVGNNSINLEGEWYNTGTFLAQNGTVILDNDAANSVTITSGGSAFYNLVIDPTAAATYTLEDRLDVDNNLTISSGTLDTKAGEDHAIYVAGDWAKDNPATFEARSGTVTFDGIGAQDVTTGGDNWSEIVVTNDSVAGVTFKDKFTCEKFTCIKPGAHLNFKYRETDEAFVITATEGLTLQGDSGDYVYLGRYGGSGDDQWYINPSGGSWNVDYVDVANSFNSQSRYINPSHYNKDSVNKNNYNWFTQEECITQIFPASSTVNSGALIYFNATNGGDCGLEPSYSWDVTSNIGSAINVDGVYASGNNDTGLPETDTVTVTDTANGVSDSATVCVGDIGCEVTINPPSQTVSSGEAIQLNAEKTGCGLVGPEPDNWEVSSTIGSSVSDSGLYTAGNNNTPSDITETITLADINNCAKATATITVKGASAVTTTIPVFPTTTTIPITSTSTTTTTIVCEISINPQSVSVNPGDTVTFEASANGGCNGSPDYEWVLSSSTDSSIDPQGAICIYTAGANESSETLTDIITLTDNANGDITVSATVKVESTVSPPSMVLSPDTMIRSRWLLIPVLMFFEGTNTHFDPSSSVITFDPDDSVLALPPLVINDTNICSLLLVMPSWLTGTENETVTVTVTTGAEVVSDTFEIEMLPSILVEEKILE